MNPPFTGHTMPGDVFMESLWRSCPLPGFPKLRGEIKADVLVVGGGLCGILCAWQLTRAGVNCVLVEADRLCCGTSGNTTAKITAQHGLIYHKLLKQLGTEHAWQYLHANLDALEAYAALADTFEFDFSRRDNFVCSDRPIRLEQELDALGTLSYPTQLSSASELPLPTAGAVCFPHQGQLHPRKLAAHLSRGLTVYEQTPVRSFDGHRWHTPEGSILAEKTIVATHFPILNKHGLFSLKMYQHRSYVLALENADSLPGMYVSDEQDGLSFREAEGKLLLGGGGHRTGKQGGGWQELEAFAADHYPHARITHRWAAQDCITLDGMPYIGNYSSNTPNLLVATGFNKWGMTGAMVAATVLTDGLLGRDNPYADLFSPSRPMRLSAAAANAFHSAVNLLTPTAPRCPHLGCALKWNAQEHSWDCPCHGSRFTESGELLEGPANADKK